ncbi:hypothetical protein NE237_023757 [Protea cynaroides]|uniref:Neprosin PEP catalytic domain-containing protein n=1 Tax=Protea cynaroides TaxID=273540 RepID=A0A9Q0HFK5_9MAGN|nr:hypothetical protein NE237_023757 [Protea cynaroides]
MKPTFFPKERANETSSAIEHVQISLKRKGCPEGTVPIRRTSKEDLLRARALSRDFSTINFSRSKKHFPGQLIVDVNYAESQLIHGASAEITLNNPIVNPSQYTNAQIWINGGPTENPNYIMAGWTDRDTGNWWLSLGKGEAHIGYWPKSLFSYLADGADSVSWGGLAKADSNGVGPPMGSGLFSNNYYSSFFNRIEFVNGLYNLAYPPNRKSVRIREDSAKCYDLHFVDYSPTYGTNFRFGGPGGLDCTYLCSP